MVGGYSTAVAEAAAAASADTAALHAMRKQQQQQPPHQQQLRQERQQLQPQRVSGTDGGPRAAEGFCSGDRADGGSEQTDLVVEPGVRGTDVVVAGEDTAAVKRGGGDVPRRSSNTLSVSQGDTTSRKGSPSNTAGISYMSEGSIDVAPALPTLPPLEEAEEAAEVATVAEIAQLSVAEAEEAMPPAGAEVAEVPSHAGAEMPDMAATAQEEAVLLEQAVGSEAVSPAAAAVAEAEAGVVLGQIGDGGGDTTASTAAPQVSGGSAGGSDGKMPIPLTAAAISPLEPSAAGVAAAISASAAPVMGVPTVYDRPASGSTALADDACGAGVRAAEELPNETEAAAEVVVGGGAPKSQFWQSSQAGRHSSRHHGLAPARPDHPPSSGPGTLPQHSAGQHAQQGPSCEQQEHNIAPGSSGPANPNTPQSATVEPSTGPGRGTKSALGRDAGLQSQLGGGSRKLAGGMTGTAERSRRILEGLGAQRSVRIRDPNPHVADTGDGKEQLGQESSGHGGGGDPRLAERRQKRVSLRHMLRSQSARIAARTAADAAGDDGDFNPTALPGGGGAGGGGLAAGAGFGFGNGGLSVGSVDAAIAAHLDASLWGGHHEILGAAGAVLHNLRTTKAFAVPAATRLAGVSTRHRRMGFGGGGGAGAASTWQRAQTESGVAADSRRSLNGGPGGGLADLSYGAAATEYGWAAEVAATPAVAGALMAAAAAEDPVLTHLVAAARRRAVEEKERRREATDVAAAGVAAGSGGKVNAAAIAAAAAAQARRLAVEAAQMAAAAAKRANDKDRISRVLYQRQSEDWAHAHGQAPPRRKLAPSVTKVVEQWFALVDNDKSGVLRAAELAAALQAAGVPCGESDILELVRLIDVNHDNTVTWGEFQTFLLKEFAAGKNLINGDYVLPSGKRLPFGAMIARLKRQRVLEDVMKGGTARSRYVDMLYNRDALATEIGLTEEAAATLDQYAPPTRHRIHQPHGGGDSRGGEDSDGFIGRSALSHTTRGGTGGPDSFIVPRSGHILMSWRDGRKRAAEALPNELEVGSLARSGGVSKLVAGGGGASQVFGGGLATAGLAGGSLAGGAFVGVGGGLAAAAIAGGGWGGGSSRAGSRTLALRAAAVAAAEAAPNVTSTAGDEGTADGWGFGETESGATFYTPHSASAAVLHGICVPAPPPVPGAPVSEGGEAVAALLLRDAANGDERGGPDSGDGPAVFLTEVAGILEVDPPADPLPTAGVDTQSNTPDAISEPRASPVPADDHHDLPSPELPVLPPLRRPDTRAFQRALLSVRREAPATLLRRIRMANPRQATAAAAAQAAVNGPPLPPPYALVMEPFLSPESSGMSRRRGDATRRGGAASPYSSASRLPGGGRSPSPTEPISPSDPALLSLDPSAATVSTSATVTLPHHVHTTKYGAGFSRYKRWSMYAIDPAAENPDYWQAKAAAMLMRHTRRTLRGVPGAGGAAAAAAATAAAAVATARDLAHRSSLLLPSVALLPSHVPLLPALAEFPLDESSDEGDEPDDEAESADEDSPVRGSVSFVGTAATARAQAAAAAGSGGEAQLLRRHELLAAQHVQARQQHRLLHEQLVAQQRLLRGVGAGKGSAGGGGESGDQRQQQTLPSLQPQPASLSPQGAPAAPVGGMWAVPVARVSDAGPGRRADVDATAGGGDPGASPERPRSWPHASAGGNAGGGGGGRGAGVQFVRRPQPHVHPNTQRRRQRPQAPPEAVALPGVVRPPSLALPAVPLTSGAGPARHDRR